MFLLGSAPYEPWMEGGGEEDEFNEELELP